MQTEAGACRRRCASPSRQLRAAAARGEGALFLCGKIAAAARASAQVKAGLLQGGEGEEGLPGSAASPRDGLIYSRRGIDQTRRTGAACARGSTPKTHPVHGRVRAHPDRLIFCEERGGVEAEGGRGQNPQISNILIVVVTVDLLKVISGNNLN